MMPQLALEQCNQAFLWQAPSSGLSVRAQCTSMPVLEVASSSGVRAKGFSLSSQRFKVSPRSGSQRCNSVSNSPTGRNTEEMQDAEFEQLGEEDLDALFEEYGETVGTDAESSSVASEVDDDSDSLAFAVALAEAANDVKGSEIQVLCVKPLIYWARFFVVVTAFSKPQIDAVGKRMRDVAEEKFNRSPKGDSKPNSWTLLDFGRLTFQALGKVEYQLSQNICPDGEIESKHIEVGEWYLKAMLLSIFFFPRKGNSTTWRNSTETLLSSRFRLQTVLFNDR